MWVDTPRSPPFISKKMSFHNGLVRKRSPLLRRTADRGGKLKLCSCSDECCKTVGMRFRRCGHVHQPSGAAVSQDQRAAGNLSRHAAERKTRVRGRSECLSDIVLWSCFQLFQQGNKLTPSSDSGGWFEGLIPFSKRRKLNCKYLKLSKPRRWSHGARWGLVCTQGSKLDSKIWALCACFSTSTRVSTPPILQVLSEAN